MHQAVGCACPTPAIYSTVAGCWMLAGLFVLSVSQHTLKSATKPNTLQLLFLELTVIRKDSKDLNMSAHKRRLKGEGVLIHTDMMRTSGNGGTINQ